MKTYTHTLFRTVLGIISIMLVISGLRVFAQGTTLTVTDSVLINAEVINDGTPVVIPDVVNLQGVYDGTDIILDWEQTYTPVTAFELYYRINPTDPYTGPITVPGTVFTYTLPNAVTNVVYHFELVTVSGTDRSGGVTTSVATPKPTPPVTPPATGGGGSGSTDPIVIPAPVITSITSPETLDAITIVWEQRDRTSFPIIEYRIFRTVLGQSFPPEEYARVAGDVFTFTDTNVQTERTYRYFVIGQDQRNVLSGNSNVVQMELIMSAPESTVTVLPPVQTVSVFPVPFIAYDALGLTDIELYYRKDGGTYTRYDVLQLYPAHPGALEENFTFDINRTGGDGFYEFYTISKNNRGIIEKTPTAPQAFTRIDRTPPAMPIATVRDGSTLGDYIAVLDIVIPEDATEMYIGTSQDNAEKNKDTARVWIPITDRAFLYYPEPGTKSISITYRDEVGLLSPTLFLRITFGEGYETIITPGGEQEHQVGEEPSESSTQTTPPRQPGDPIDSLPDNPGSTPSHPRETDDISNAFYRDSDGDGVSDGDEETYYGTNPYEFTNFDFEDVYFTTNIRNYSRYHAGEEVVIFGLIPPASELRIYVIHNETKERTYLGGTTGGEDRRYFLRTRMPEETGTYSMEFQLKPKGASRIRIYERIQLQVRARQEEPFYSHFFVNLQHRFLYDIYTFEEYKNSSLNIIKALLEQHQQLDAEEVLSTARPRLGLRHFIPESSKTQLRDPLTLQITWIHATNPTLWYAQQARVLMNDDFLYVTPPRDLEEGTYEVFVQAIDANGYLSYPRMITFTIAGLSLHPITESPSMEYLLKDCLKVLYLMPDFWLWLLIAFLLGATLATVGYYVTRPVREQGNYKKKKAEEHKEQQQ